MLKLRLLTRLLLRRAYDRIIHQPDPHKLAEIIQHPPRPASINQQQRKRNAQRRSNRPELPEQLLSRLVWGAHAEDTRD